MTDVTLTAVLGLPMEATATVKTDGADLGITPHGQITFVVRNGSGVEIYTGFANLGDDGIATLAEALPATSILVDTVGHWSIDATYLKSDTDMRYVGTGVFKFDSVDVEPGGVILQVTAPSASPLGSPVNRAREGARRRHADRRGAGAALRLGQRPRQRGCHAGRQARRTSRSTRPG